MGRVREILPEHSAEELLDEYISRLSGQTVEGSCINQTQSGCGLPRELRASNCNTYFCHGIRDLHVKFENESCLPPVLAIKRSNNNWNRFDPSFENEIIEAVLIDGDSVQQVEVK